MCDRTDIRAELRNNHYVWSVATIIRGIVPVIGAGGRNAGLRRGRGGTGQGNTTRLKLSPRNGQPFLPSFVKGTILWEWPKSINYCFTSFVPSVTLGSGNSSMLTSGNSLGTKLSRGQRRQKRQNVLATPIQMALGRDWRPEVGNKAFSRAVVFQARRTCSEINISSHV